MLLFLLSPGLLFCLSRQQGEEATQPHDMHTKGDSALSDRRPPWRWLSRRCDSTTATVLFADGMVRPSWASERIDALWAKRTTNTILEVYLRQTRREGGLSDIHAKGDSP